jgi:intracellular septation protein A
VKQLATFLRALTGPAWFCCLVAGVSGLLGIYAWLPLPHQANRVTIYILFAAMAACAVGFMSIVGHHLITWEHRKDPQPTVCLPKVYWHIATWSLAYFFAVFVGAFIYYPHGVDLGPWVNLRIASAGSLFLSIAALGFTQWAGLRVRALQSAL